MKRTVRQMGETDRRDRQARQTGETKEQDKTDGHKVEANEGGGSKWGEMGIGRDPRLQNVRAHDKQIQIMIDGSCRGLRHEVSPSSPPITMPRRGDVDELAPESRSLLLTESKSSVFSMLIFILI